MSYARAGWVRGGSSHWLVEVWGGPAGPGAVCRYGLALVVEVGEFWLGGRGKGRARSGAGWIVYGPGVVRSELAWSRDLEAR